MAMNLVTKLVEVRKSLSRIRKSGYNSHQNYSYVSEADILDAIKAELDKVNVFIFSSLKEKTKSDKMTEVIVDNLIVNGDDMKESFSVLSYGQGSDTQDKGCGKALTNASKYFFLKNFLIATGDDPEATDETGKSTRGSAPTKSAAPSVSAPAAKAVVPFSKKALTKATTVSTGDDI